MTVSMREVRSFIRKHRLNTFVPQTQRFMVYVYNNGDAVIEDVTVGSLEAATGFCKQKKAQLKKETPQFKPLFVIHPIPVKRDELDLTVEVNELI